MTDRMINNRVAKMMELKALIDGLTDEMNGLKAEIVDYMAGEGVEVVETGKYKVISKVIMATTFDSKSFKKDHSDLYNAYVREGSKSYWKISEK